MATLRELVYKIGVSADTAGLKRFQAGVAGVSDAFGRLAQQAAKAMAVGIGVGAGLGLLTKNTAQFAEEVDRAARSLQMSRQEFQEYQAGFAALGGTTDDLMDALATINERTLKAVEGSSTYAKEFARVGVAVKDLKGLKPAQIFDTFTAAAAKSTDRNAALAASVALFGDDLGRRIMPALVEGGEGFDALRKLVADTGLALDDVAVDKGRKLAFEFRRLDFLTRGLSRQLGAELGPALTTLAMKMGDFLQERGAQLIDWFDAAGEEAGRWVTKLTTAIDNMNRALGGDTKALDATADALYRISLVMTYGVAGVGLVALVGALASGFAYIGVVGLALYGVITGLTVGLEDLWVYLNGGASLSGLLAEKFAWLDVELMELRRTFADAKDAFANLSAAASRLFRAFSQEGPAGVSLLDLALAGLQGLLVVTVNLLTQVVIVLVDLTAWFLDAGAAAMKGSQEAYLGWSTFFTGIYDIGTLVLGELSDMLTRTIDLMVLVPRIVGEVAGKIRSGDLEGAVGSALGAAGRVGENVLAYGQNNLSSVRRIADAFDQPLQQANQPLVPNNMVRGALGAAEGREVEKTINNRTEVRIGSVTLATPAGVDQPAQWAESAWASLADEMRTSNNLFMVG